MSENTTVPSHITQGDSAEWSITLDDYPASAGWVLSYAMVKDGAMIAVSSSVDGDKHKITCTTTQTSAWAPGVYLWTATVSKDLARRTITQGMIEILPDLSQMTDGGDLRSHVKRTLDALESAIERHAETGTITSSIGGRSTTWRSYEELLALRIRYRAEYNRELVKAGLRKPQNLVLTRF